MPAHGGRSASFAWLAAFSMYTVVVISRIQANQREVQPPTARLLRNSYGVARHDGIACQNSSITYSDVTFYVVSSVDTYQTRVPPLLNTWIGEVERRGATVRVFVGPGDQNFSHPNVVRVPRDLGRVNCSANPPEHCDAMFREHTAWLAANAATLLVCHVDDDSVIHVDRFLAALRCLPHPAAELWMLGLCRKVPWEKHAFCTGGASFTYPARLLPGMARCHAGAGRADDVQASWCAMVGGATLVHHPFFFYGTMRRRGWVTAHHVRPEQVPIFYRDPTIRKAA